MKVRYREGGALKSEVLSLEVRVAQAREDLIRAQNNRSRTVAALANLLGLDPDTPLAPTAGGPGYKGMPADYWSGIPYALAHRPELEKARRRISRSRMALDLARSSYLPRMDARFHYYHDTPNSTLDFESERQNWTAGIMLNWDLFTGFRTWARVQQAKGVLQEMLAADKKTAQAVRLELKTAFLRLEEAHARLAVTQASVAQARESLNLVKQQYGGGSVTVTRYLNAELAHNRARIRAAAARHDREKARAAVARALGYWGRAYPAAPPGGDPP
jgi:outer membrane protein TolC